MQQDTHLPRRLRFGVFEADLSARELTKLGKRLWLQEQPFQLLAMLLEKPGELVTREELQASLWPQTVVDFDHGLNKAISKIRDALGDSADNPRFVQTIARRGYRFLADVTVVGSKQIETAPAQIGVSDPLMQDDRGASKRRSRRVAAWTKLGLALSLLLVVFLILLIRALSTSSSYLPAIRSVAVMPLENLSGDASQDYFADGMTDELITHLAQISSLRVISRSSVMSYKTVHKSLVEIARALNVEAVVEGSILRSGERVRITAQLIRVPADQHIWAQSYEGNIGDTLTLQSHVAQAIADQIRVNLSRAEQAALQKSKTVNAEAYDAYLKGRYYWNKRTGEGLKQAIEYFKRSIAMDPSNAEAYAGLADSYALSGDWEYGILAPAEAFAQAKAAANEALALDDSLGEAHTSLAFVLDLYGWDWDAAEKQYRLAIRLSPGYATAHHWYAFHLLVMGHNSEGIFELRKAENLDPLSLIIGADVADALCIAHLFDESEQQSQRTLALDANFALGHFVLGQALVQKRQHEAAITEFQKAIELSGHRAVFDSNLAYAYAVSGRKAEALKIAKDLEGRPDSNPSANANIALIYVGLGDRDQAMTWLNKAFDARFNPSILLRPGFDSLRSDARFQNLWRRIGLPPRVTSAWRQDNR
jgi:TolB-like protein/DNA-binding winged helix-turn-helix (wHTH) protein/Flp pilus assembly protein TadD